MPPKINGVMDFIWMATFYRFLPGLERVEYSEKALGRSSEFIAEL